MYFAVEMAPRCAAYCDRMEQGQSSSSLPDGGQFTATRWTLVLTAARGTATPQATQALEELCRIYWYPLYAFVRRRGYDRHTAEDRTQEFFMRFLATHSLAKADRAICKFRAFLLASMKHFLANEWDKSRAQKRGGGAQNFTSFDTKSAEARYAMEPADPQTPEKAFERNWALTLLDEVLRRVRKDYAAEDKAVLFDALKATLTGQTPVASYSEIATRLGMSEGAVKIAAHRLRHRYRDALRAEIAQTVTSAEEVDDELQHLFAAVSG